MQMANAGSNLYFSDYDDRTALHLTACEGHYKALKFLIDSAPDTEKEKILSFRDRWGGTPLGEAIHYNHADCVKLLTKHGAI